MSPSKPAEAAKKAVAKMAKKVAEMVEPPIPGAPNSEPPSLEEPTEPREPLPPKPDQGSPETRTPTGAPTGAEPTDFGQQGPYLTTAQGLRLYDTDHSLKAGERGPTLLQDHHLREKIMHFDHERIPERVVHARGAAAHGVFTGYGAAAQVCKAGFLAEKETPVFVRFSNVVGSRGSADVVRDTRGFAVKFYTDEGTFDLVGNNIPVFFIQDGIKFPDIVHAAKPHPDREIPQAQSAHDTFWDFVSLHTEAQHHTIWQMSDRGIPRSWRTMEGFGVHTFRLVNAAGETSLVKFHWKPAAGVHSVTWEEAQLVNGVDPDFHRRDLADAIEAGAFPRWELGIQIFPDTPEQMFEGIDLLDSSKIVPEELAPVQPVGMLTLNRNPTNYFAETEQVAFHPGHLVPGIDLTDDPLLQARLFSYLDTQLNRFGGKNFGQIPINRPHAPVNDMLRDGYHQTADHAGAAPYRPNSLDGGCPFLAGEDVGAYVEVARPVVESVKKRQSPASFADHFSQTRMFWLSLTPVEKDHTMRAYAFELGKCYEQAIKQRQLIALANIDADLCAGVAAELGLPVPEATQPLPDVAPSPSLSQLGRTWPVEGRMIGIVVDPTNGLDGVREVKQQVTAAGMVPLIVAPHGGLLEDGLPAQRSFLTARSVEFDAILLAGTPAPAPDASASFDAKAGAPFGAEFAAESGVAMAAVDPRVTLMIAEAFRHSKAIGGWGDAEIALASAGCSSADAGIVVGDQPSEVLTQVIELLGAHRVWERFPTILV